MSAEVIPYEVKQLQEAEQFSNSLTALTEQIFNGNPFPNGQTISGVDTLFDNNRWYLISNLRQLLSELYVEHGIVQTLVDQPVEDAYRAGFTLTSSQLDEDDKKKLMVFSKRNHVIDAAKEARIWARLFGGGAVMIITNQNPASPLDISRIKTDSPLEFRPIDMWELYTDVQNVAGTMRPGEALGANRGDHYSYYGVQVHKSRVYKLEGKQPPSFIKPRLRGWGMSELERLVRSLNQYMKNQDVLFELLDEAKVDVMKIKNFNSSLVNKNGTSATAQRIQLANQIKNYNHALIMDADDDYIQKQITFAGLAEVMTQIRQGIAADLKMPMTKLFGISSAGFSSGEDDIENYNSMVESEVRAKDEIVVVDLLSIACQKVHGFVPDDLEMTWNPLRVLNAKEEEEVKDSQANRVLAIYDRGLCSAKEAKESINTDTLIAAEVDVNAEALPPNGMQEDVPAAKGGAGKQAPKEA